MKRIVSVICLVCVALHGLAVEQKDTILSGKVRLGTIINASQIDEDMDLTYKTNDKRLGSNSGNHYFSEANCKKNDVLMLYGAEMKIKMWKKHQLGLTIEGKQNWENFAGMRTEYIYDNNGTQISNVGSSPNHPQDMMSDVLAGANYTYSFPRKGESLTVGYRYHLDYTSSDLEQHVQERSGWALFETNLLNQRVKQQTHRAWVDYVCPVVKGHTIEVGTAWERRQIDSHTGQVWDQQCCLDADYRHLTQYGALYARYRLAIGPVKAQLGMEYRFTKMQQRWLHDVVPTAMVRWQVDSVHALMGGYRMLIIRPEASLLDTNKVREAFTQSFGNDALVGVHVHNMHITYQMTMEKLCFSTEIRYITANDGLNALWMERNNVRIYTWGNEGIRHAVGLTPKIEGRVGKTTQMKWEATMLWDERIAKAINMKNDNWGISTQLGLEQQLPQSMAIDVQGSYAYHNTLDLYSYSGHGGQVGIDWRMAFLREKKLKLKLGYTCRFIPDIHITQGGWTGLLSYHSSCTHLVEIQLGYTF